MKRLPPGTAFPGARLTLALLVVALLLCQGAAHAAPGASTLEYLYVEANEGDSSGGHAALRFGRETFHFQYERPGIFRIQRLDSTTFNHIYARLGNRPIHGSSIAVSEETYNLLREALQELLLIQDAQMAIRQDLRRNRAFLELLEQRHVGLQPPAPPLPLRGVGYFLPDSADDTGPGTHIPPAPALLELREWLQATQGKDVIRERSDRLERQIRELAPESGTTPLTPLSRENLSPSVPTIAARYNDLLLALFALKILQAAPPLRPGTFWTPDSDEFRLDEREWGALERLARRQRDQLRRLAGSPRPDWGFPFVVGMARLCALDASLRSGRLTFLNIFPVELHGSGQNTPPRHGVRLPADQVAALTAERRRLFRLRRAEFFASETPREADYALLERTGNLLLEAEQALATGRAPRRPPEASFPSREALRSDTPLPELDGTTLAREREAAQAAEQEYTALLLRLYPYNLVLRNCVTELFATINRALERSVSPFSSPTGTPRASAREESEKRLGGFIDPAQGLVFVPFLSAAVVNSRYRVVSRTEHLSHRRLLLTEMKKRESPLLVFLRESNTLTSTIYRPAPGDSLFLFFTDDVLLPRPLFGAFNLLAGAGESLLGLATLPFQGPARLLAGTRGMLFSLPELFFVNIRKGTMEYVETVQRQEPEL